MSVRIYQLAKELDMDNQVLMAVLKERGYQIKSPSSTVDNISADSLREEFTQKSVSAPPLPEGTPPPAPQQQAPHRAALPAPAEVLAPAAPIKPAHAAPRVRLPEGVFVKSKAEVDLERQTRETQAATFESKRRPMPPPPGQPKPAPRPAEGHVSIRKETPQYGQRPATPPPLPQTQRQQHSRQESPAPAPAPKPAPQAADAGPKRSAPMRLPMPTLARVPLSSAATTKYQGQTQDKGILQLRGPIIVREFAKVLFIKPFQLISELMECGIFASMGQTIEPEVAARVAKRHGYTLEIKQRGDGPRMATAPKVVQKEKEEPRPPVVCILGHVDHGKTTLLDTLRKTNVVAGEPGGITQHIGAYQVQFNGKPITFIDTPGHAAFETMRARGAHITDIAILIVAADEGFKPQTDEALKHARAANVPIIVAINKIDAKAANIDRVKTQMQERGIGSEDWGHDTITVPISALKGENLDELLEMILLQGEMMELKAPITGMAQAAVLESHVDVGHGPCASVIIQSGTLKTGDAVVCGTHFCKIRTMTDSLNRPIKAATPAVPVKISGWSGTPEAGAIVVQVKDEKEARKQAEAAAIALAEEINEKPKPVVVKPKRGIDQLNILLGLAPGATAQSPGTEQKKLYVIVKADVSGSAEAVCESLLKINSKKIRVEIVDSEVGPITLNDVRLAETTNAVIVGFNTRLEPGAAPRAKQFDVSVLQNNIIYKLIEDVEEKMVSMLPPEKRENKLGTAEVRQVFSVSGNSIAGCMVTQGLMVRGERVRVLNNRKPVGEGKLRTLRRFKDDAAEVRSGHECGIQVERFSDFHVGDILECFGVEELRPTL